MARACPACNRPNAEAASKCLYCNEPLEPIEPRTPREATADASRPEGERQILILVPGGEPSDDIVEEFSRITGMDRYGARMSLKATRPRLFRRLDSEAAAREISEQLTRVRVPHYVVSEDAVTSLAISRARRAELHERHVRFDLETTGLTLPFQEMLLLVRGEIVRERHDDKRLGSAKGVTHRLTPDLRLHLYGQEASMAVEIDPETFDWSVLGENRTSSSVLNLERFLSQLALGAPGVETDRGFDHEPVVLSRTESGGDVTGALAESDRGLEGVVYDNEEQFRFYSRWRFCLSRHLRRG